jgi:hypothetical protein
LNFLKAANSDSNCNYGGAKSTMVQYIQLAVIWANPILYACGYNPSGGARRKPNLPGVGAKPSGGAVISHWKTLSLESDPTLTFL